THAPLVRCSFDPVIERHVGHARGNDQRENILATPMQQRHTSPDASRVLPQFAATRQAPTILRFLCTNPQRDAIWDVIALETLNDVRKCSDYLIARIGARELISRAYFAVSQL